jgi:hypothetical protein
MPYNLERGPYLAMLEDLINSDLVRSLEYLRQPDKPLTGIMRDRLAPIEGGPYTDTARLADHIDRDWFGIPAGGSDEQGVSHYWGYWRGDAQGIVRETLVRAIEVALGVEHDQPADGGTRRWPVSVLTACTVRWFEGWVTWRKVAEGAGGGHVLVLLLTPSHGKPAEATLLRPTASSPGRPGEPYTVNPKRADGDQGMWAIGAVLERRADPESASAGWRPAGSFPRPHLGPTYEGEGGVVVVAPPESQGGVLPTGRAYQGVAS